jgi:hypothetical protein
MTPTLWMNRSQGDTDLDYKIIQWDLLCRSILCFGRLQHCIHLSPQSAVPGEDKIHNCKDLILLLLEVLPNFPLTKKRERLKKTPLALKIAEPVNNYSRCKDAYGSERSHWKLEHPDILCLVTIHTWEVYQHVCQYLDSNVVLFVWTEGAA